MQIGLRLIEERKRLGLSQDATGASLGVTRLTQGTYERGDSVPDALYLVGFRQLGGDAWYVLTGERQSDTLAKDESLIIDLYRQMDQTARGMVLAMMTGHPAAQSAKPTVNIQTGKVSQFIASGEVNQPGAQIGFHSEVKRSKPSKK